MQVGKRSEVDAAKRDHKYLLQIQENSAALTICLRHAAPFGMEEEAFHVKRHVFLEAVNLGSLQVAEVQGHTVDAAPVAGPDAAAALPGGELGEPT